MPKRPIKAEDLLNIHYVGDPQISPDGTRILFGKKHITSKNKYLNHLYLVDQEGATTQLTQGESGSSSGKWSPDGKQISFLSARSEEIGQIFLLSLEGGEARKLTSLPEGSIGTYDWSPDGKWIAFTYRQTDAKWTKASAKDREAKGLSTPAREIDTIWYRLDGDGYFLNERHELFVVNIASGEHHRISSDAWDGNYNFDWLSSSDALIVSRSAAENVAFDPPNDQLFRIDLKGKSTMLPGLPKGNKASLQCSPDGKWIGFLGDVSDNDPWGVRNTKLYVVPVNGGEPRCLTEGQDYDLNVATLSDSKEASFEGTLIWSPDSKALYSSIGWHGENQIGFIELEKGGVKLLTKGNHQVVPGSISANGEKFGVLFGHPTMLPEVGVFDLSKNVETPQVLTKFNQEFHDEIELSEPTEMWLESTDGAKVHTWVMMPVGVKQGALYPAVLHIHGGPHTQYGWAFFHEFQVFAAQGYVVVYSNPRGSKGYGEDFCAAIKGDWGNKDWDDVQTITRWMQNQPLIDAGKLGVMGGSYGGYMTNWAIGHTNDYAAAISDRCVSNLVSMAGSSDFPFNRDGYFGGCAWSSLEDIAPLWKQSPLAYFTDVKTPTLVIHSEGDLRCNVEQGEQVFHALQAQGVPSRFVRYPQSTFHGLSRNGPPDLRLHRLAENVGWMDRFLK